MFRNLFPNLFEKLAQLRAKLNRAKRVAVRTYRTRLEMEQLEDRTLLDGRGNTLLWVGAQDGAAWNNPVNWANLRTGAEEQPEIGDTFLFDPTAITGMLPNSPPNSLQKQGANTSSQTNLGYTLQGLIIKNYTNTITLNANVTVNSNAETESDPVTRFDMESGTISITADHTLTIKGGAAWTSGENPNPPNLISGGKLMGEGTTLLDEGAYMTLTNTPTFVGHAFNINGIVNWDNGDINTDNALIEIQSKGTLIARSAGTIRYVGTAATTPGAVKIMGENGSLGLFTRDANSTATGTTTVQIQVIAEGIPGHLAVDVQKGNLDLKGGGHFRARFQAVNPNTRIDFGGPDVATASVSDYWWDSGTEFIGPGRYQVSEWGKASVGAGTTVDVSNLTLRGEVAGPGILQVISRLDWHSGIMSGSGKTVIMAGAKATLGGPDGPSPTTVTLDERTLENRNEIEIKGVPTSGGGGSLTTLEVANGAVIDNYKSFFFRDDSSITFGDGYFGLFLNKVGGLLEKTGGSDTSTIGIPVWNLGGTIRPTWGNGKLRVNNFVVMVDGLLDMNGGILEVAGTFEQSGGLAHLQDEGEFRLEDTATVSAGNILVEGGSALTTTNAAKAFTQSGGTVWVQGFETLLAVAGSLDLSGGTLAVNYQAEMTVGGSLDQSGGTLNVGPNFGELTVSGDVALSGGILSVEGADASLEVTGEVTVGSGATLELLDGGQLSAGGGVEISSGGVLNAFAALITGDLVNSGTINLVQDGVPYTLFVDGDYTQTGTLNVTLTDDGTWSRLKVTGTATLDGTLDVSLAGVFPVPSSQYTIVEAGTLSGTFGTLSLDPPSQGFWNPIYDATLGTLTLRVEE